MDIEARTTLYVSVTTLGYLLVLPGGTLLSRLFKNKLENWDIFKSENETFPQEERLLQNEFSINLPSE